ncbi:ATP-dependent DNA helicase RecG [uncultured Gardnerella sp.]|uniref:ATP-dependent DNA helicase RecG n=1 Tax=uncultured Gardnerella sp. TaxID=293424 RepID=UPI002601A26D|nr:ATP-dependent DNA helicase RecG [uncultured Gardnerella sp.]
MSITLETSLASIMSNKRRISALKSLGVLNIKDALTYYPFRVCKPMKVMQLKDIRSGDSSVFVCVVDSVCVVPMNSRHGFRLEVNVCEPLQNVVNDFQDSSSVSCASLIYFSQKKPYIDWMLSKFHKGEKIVVCGVASEFNSRLQFTHPNIMNVCDEKNCNNNDNNDLNNSNSVEYCLKKLSSPMPMYHANSRISSEHIHDVILLAMDSIEENIPDIIPESMRKAHNLLHRKDAFFQIHNPQSIDDFKKALETLRYEEALVSQIAILSSRNSSYSAVAQKCACNDMRNSFINSLPFELTKGQNEVIGEILKDMCSNKPMRRLLQGEVGSGKTVVAMSAMLQAIGSCKQAVLVAPTHVLALQHADNLRNMIHKAGLPVKLIVVTGGMKLSERRKALASVASGEPAIIVATHAAFSSSFNPTNLALVVIDEQHRFGVEQRNSLMRSFGSESTVPPTVPHLLVMTATPIPRSAAMTWFGDLDASYLTQLPAERKPIRTIIVKESDSHTMAAMFKHIRSRIDCGERAYIVCPHIEDSEIDSEIDSKIGSKFSLEIGSEIDSKSKSISNLADDNKAFDNESFIEEDENIESKQVRKLHTVTNILKRLSSIEQFNNIRLIALTGRNSDEEKQEIMRKFISGVAPILVSTTVIEVGVDVKNATCMVIFDADRFGLAQLHQLRGRIGRSNLQSWAFLVSCAEDGSLASKRLQVVENSCDGAVIAQEDLRLRNVGDVLGDRQSGGKSSLKLLRVIQDASIIASARKDASELIANESELNEMQYLRGAVLDFTRIGSIISN